MRTALRVLGLGIMATVFGLLLIGRAIPHHCTGTHLDPVEEQALSEADCQLCDLLLSAYEPAVPVVVDRLVGRLAHEAPARVVGLEQGARIEEPARGPPTEAVL